MGIIIDSATKSPNAALVAPGVFVDGFSSGDPQIGLAATQFTAAWCNGVQSEIGLAITKLVPGSEVNNNHGQLGASILERIRAQVNDGGLSQTCEWRADYIVSPTDAAAATEWKEYRTSQRKVAAAKNTVHHMCSFTPPDDSQILVEYRAVVAAVQLASARANYVWHASFRRSGNVVSQDGEIIYSDNNIADLTVTPVESGTSIRLDISVPNTPNDTYNIFVTGTFTVVTLDT